ncbi:hypothetical protein D3C72_1491340 [compost metagenome]
MAHELAFHAQAAGVQDLVAVDDHGVFQRTAAGQTGLTQGLDLMGEAEGAGGHDVRAEGRLVHDEVHHLIADDRRREVDLEAHFVAVAGQKDGGLVALLHPNRLQDLDVANRGFLTAETGAIQQLHELQGRTVQDRQLGAVDLDHGVGHAQRAQGGHQVLDGRQAHARRVLDHGVQAGVDDGLARDGDAVVAVGDVGAHEGDARAGRGRTHDQLDALAGVNADAGADGRGDDGLFVMVVTDRQGETLCVARLRATGAEFASPVV